MLGSGGFLECLPVRCVSSTLFPLPLSWVFDLSRHPTYLLL